jgi:CHAT domain-containing protein/tetratricopeptide (TPR) repeat protein
MRSIGNRSSAIVVCPGALVLFMFLCAIAQNSIAFAAGASNARWLLYAQSKSKKLDEAKRLGAEAKELRQQGKYGEGIPLAERALAIYENVRGPEHTDVALALNNLAELYQKNGNFVKAESLYQRALAIYEKTVGPRHPATAATLNNLAVLYQVKGDYVKAELLFQRALAIGEKALGPQHSNVAARLNNLATLYRARGEYAKAEPLYQRALAIYEKTLGPMHPETAATLNNLGQLYQDRGDYVKAEPLYQRALSIWVNTLGPEHPYVATVSGNLARLCQDKGEYMKAEPLFQRALAIDEKVLGPHHPDLAGALNNLGVLYQEKGDYEKAEQLYQRALGIGEKALGTEHPSLAADLNNLAVLYRVRSEYAKAEPLFQRALAIWMKALGPEHPSVAGALANLGALYQEKGDYVEAEPLYQQALAIWMKALGPEHPDVATGLHNLAALYRTRGEYAKAEPLFQRALAIEEKALGPLHPSVAVTLNNLAALYEGQANVQKAVAFRAKATDISEHNLALNLETGSERQKLFYLATFSDETNHVISLQIGLAAGDPSALQLALTTVLRRKGRTLDTTADIFEALRRRLNPQTQELLDQLTAARAQLASLTLGGPGQKEASQYRAEITALEEQIESLEDRLSRQSQEFRTQSQPVTLAAVQAAIPADAMLVEFVSFAPYNLKQHKWEPRHYVAYVLGNQGQPAWAELGAADVIDKAVNALRAVLRKDRAKPLSDIEREVKAKARALDQKIMQPVRKLLGNKRKLLLSPDGALNLIPFAALVDERGKYLVETYSLVNLTTGRDLLRLQMRMENKQGTTVFANPDFGQDKTAASGRTMKGSAQPSSPQAIDFSQVYFRSLSGTAEEAQALKVIFPDAKVWTEQQATKTALKEVNAPSILHIATHGFFLDDLVVSAQEVKSRGLLIRPNQPGETPAPEFQAIDPLLRSGLAMAGANLHRGGDGILTAKEASGLNLWGTKLVVLSACDTGVGEIKNGEGVYGLRRALVLAGSETQVMSLWPVSDEGTRDLMIDYYKALKAGQGRSEALRQVQLKMLATGNRKHPYFWASFIQSGEWANLDGKR